MATREVGKPYVLSYKDVKTDADGWADPKHFRPKPFDLVYLRVIREGEERLKGVPGWWTGSSWDGQRLLSSDQVICWKYKEPKHE